MEGRNFLEVRMSDDEFGDQLNLMNAKISALMKDLREARKDDPDFSELAGLSVAEIAVELAAIEIVALETEEPDPDRLRELVSKHARTFRDA
jgi:hypothetical protein